MNQPLNHLDQALNILNEAVFVYNQDMEIIYFNKAAEKTTGLSRESVLGKKCVSIFDKSICLNNCELCLTVKQGLNEEIQFQSPFLTKEGKTKIGIFRGGLLSRNKDGQTKVLVSITDITELMDLRKKVQENRSFRKIIGKSSPMRELFQTIQNVALYDSTVFIQGESGTGKELVAHAIHKESPRAKQSFVKVNCSSFSDNLLESELFGHVRGAFTGAVRDRIGRFEEANGGTIFLDEVGDLSLNIQVKLLRVLQEKEIERVGENKTRKVDIRIVTATNKNISQEIKKGLFREDLFYRLNVIPIYLSPLRERKLDIPLLADHFVKIWNQNNSKTIKSLSEPALRKLMDYNWPGNVRELENVIEHASVKCMNSLIDIEDLPLPLQAWQGNIPKRKKKRKWLNKQLILDALEQCSQNQSQAAKILDVHRITLWRKMKELKIPLKAS